MTELKVQSRKILGRKVDALRRAGFLPAVVYGDGVASQPIAVPFKDFEKAYKEAGESTLVKLDVDGMTYNVLIHDITYDPLKNTPLHADFYAVRMDKEIRTNVPVEFINESPAIKNDGGILVKVMQEIEVEALPQDLPHELKADLSILGELGSKLFVRDLSLPKGVKVMLEDDEVVALIDAPRSDAELEELAVAQSAEVKEVLTEQEIKKAEETAKAVAEKPEE